MDGLESTVSLRDLACPVDVGHAQPPPICPEGISQPDISDTNQAVSLTTGISGPCPSQAL